MRLFAAACLCYALGVAWIAAFPAASITTGELKCRGTYFSENALLNGAAKPTFRGPVAALAPPDALAALAAAGLEPYGDYAILRAAPGADGTESVVLAARPSQPAAVAVAVALAEHLAGVSWLSKDVVVLLTEDAQAWADAYFRPVRAHDPVNASLPMHAGALRAALAVDLRPDAPWAVLGAGHSGRLPNLDLVNVAAAALKSETGAEPALDRCGLRHEACDDALARLHARWAPRRGSYADRLLGLARFMRTLALGANGEHAAFLDYSVDAVTVAGDPSKGDLTELARALERTLRSLSTTEEKLHQSFFLYLLPGPQLFVSIGEYYYSLVLVLLPLVAHALLLARPGLAVAAPALAAEAMGLALWCLPVAWRWPAHAAGAALVCGLARGRSPAELRSAAGLLAVYAHMQAGILNFAFAIASALAAVPLLLLLPYSAPLLSAALVWAGSAAAPGSFLEHWVWLVGAPLHALGVGVVFVSSVSRVGWLRGGAHRKTD